MVQIKISTWNVNSINARLENILNWLSNEKPDIVMLQEIKCQSNNFPYQYIEDLNYNIIVNGQKSYNGVAILSKFPISNVTNNFPSNPITDEARFIQCDININDKLLNIASVYVPNGKDIGTDSFENKIIFSTQIFKFFISIF